MRYKGSFFFLKDPDPGHQRTYLPGRSAGTPANGSAVGANGSPPQAVKAPRLGAAGGDFFIAIYPLFSVIYPYFVTETELHWVVLLTLISC